MRPMDGASGLLRRTAAASIAVIAVLVALPAAQAGSTTLAETDQPTGPQVVDVVLVRPTASTAAVQVRLSAPLPGARTASVRLAGESRTWACRSQEQATVLRCPVSGVPVGQPLRVEVQT